MSIDHSDPALAGGRDENRHLLVALLADYLFTSASFHLPGSDGATVEDVVAAEYPSASTAGWVPRPTDLAAKYPNLADTILDFFAPRLASNLMTC